MEHRGAEAGPVLEPVDRVALMILRGCRHRWFDPSPGRTLLAVLAAEGLLWLWERFRWFPFDHHKGWAVVNAVGVLGGPAADAPSAGRSAFRWRFQFSLRSLLLLPVGVAIPFSWLATQMRAAGEQREVVKDVVELVGA